MAAWLPQVADKQQLTEVGDRFRANLPNERIGQLLVTSEPIG